MTRREIIAAWNAQADDANSWHHLGEDEKLEWAIKLEREACAKMCDYVYDYIVTDGHIKDMACKIRARGKA